MSVQFSYSLARRETPSDLQPGIDLQDGDLRYSLFKGTIGLRVNEVDFALSSRIPLLDFAAGQLFLLDALETSAYEEFDFTEGEGVIRYRRAGRSLTLSATYVAESVTCDFDEYREAAALFARALVAEIKVTAPEIAGSAAFANLEFRMFGGLV
jgi:hypothetical protein